MQKVFTLLSNFNFFKKLH